MEKWLEIRLFLKCMKIYTKRKKSLKGKHKGKLLYKTAPDPGQCSGVGGGVFDIAPGGAYNGGRPRSGGVCGSLSVTFHSAQARAFSHTMATVKRLTVCGRQKAVYGSACVALNASALKRLLVTGRQRAV